MVAGDALLKMGSHGLAFHMFRTAAQIEPEWDDAWCNMGVALQESRVMDQARACYMKAFEINPENAEVLGNLCALENDFGEHEKSVAWAEKSLAVEDNDHARYNGALSLLALKRWDKAWDWYRTSIGSKERMERFFGDHVERWDGKPTTGLVVYTEQGLGDEILHASMFRDVLNDNKDVVIECSKKVERLFRRSFPQATVYGTRPTKWTEDDWIEWPLGHNLTAKIEAGGLGEFYRRDDESFPKEPFLIADPEQRIQWRALLDSLPDKPNIGIAWHAGKVKTKGGERSMSLEDMLPMLKYDANWISLEYHVPDESEISNFSQKHGIDVYRFPHGTETDDYDNTAALVSELDLVVSVTTTVVDLCGALGKECWAIVPENAPWRYCDEPIWYPNQSFYRQVAGEWPLSDVYSSLHKWRRAPLPAPENGAFGATYDLGKAPSSYDFLSWLVHAKMQAGNRPLEVQFINEGNWRKDGLPLSSDDRQWMMDHVLRPALRLVDAKEGKGGAEFGYMLKPVVEGGKHFPVPKFQATDKAKEFVAKFKAQSDKPLIVITTRETDYWPERNSNMDAWLKFAKHLWMAEYRVVFVRDTNKIHEVLPKVETAPWASIDLDLRMALYEAADLNMAVNNGPCHLLYFSDSEYVVFNQLVDGVPGCSPDWWAGNIGVDVGNQYPWSGPGQTLAWLEDSADNIKEAFDQWQSTHMPR